MLFFEFVVFWTSCMFVSIKMCLVWYSEDFFEKLEHLVCNKSFKFWMYQICHFGPVFFISHFRSFKFKRKLLVFLLSLITTVKRFFFVIFSQKELEKLSTVLQHVIMLFVQSWYVAKPKPKRVKEKRGKHVSLVMYRV